MMDATVAAACCSLLSVSIHTQTVTRMRTRNTRRSCSEQNPMMSVQRVQAIRCGASSTVPAASDFATPDGLDSPQIRSKEERLVRSNAQRSQRDRSTLDSQQQRQLFLRGKSKSRSRFPFPTCGEYVAPLSAVA